MCADTANRPAPLPESSPFPDLKTARRFAGPLPFTFDYEPQTHSIVKIEGVHENWDPQPVAVEVSKATFLIGRRLRIWGRRNWRMRFIWRMCLTGGKEADVSSCAHNDNPTATMPAPRARGAFEGMLNVVRFNWPLYAVGASVAAAAVMGAILIPMPNWFRVILFCGAGAAIYLLAASLIISHVIYDRSPLYRFEWAQRWAGENPRRILNMHSGFDESSESLRAAFPDAHLQILELHDPARMTEPSIARARRCRSRSRRLARANDHARPTRGPVIGRRID